MEYPPFLPLNLLSLNRIPVLYPSFYGTEPTQLIPSPHPGTPIPPGFIALVFYFVYIVNKRSRQDSDEGCSPPLLVSRSNLYKQNLPRVNPTLSKSILIGIR